MGSGSEAGEPSSRFPVFIGMPHMVVIVTGVILGILLVSWPFAMHMSIVRHDDAIAHRTDEQASLMSREEHDMRLLAAQWHNALVAGWSGWQSSLDNEGMAGGSFSTREDIPDPPAEALDSWDGEMFDRASPLDVGDGLIGWACLPTGRRLAISDDTMRCADAQNLFRMERWSCLPVGGHGTLCVLSLPESESSSVVESDLLGMSPGDDIVIGVLGDSYSYEVVSIDSGPQSTMISKLTKATDKDRMAVLVGKDTSGEVTVIVAERVRYGGMVSGITSPAIVSSRNQMLLGIVVGFLAILVFTWPYVSRRQKETGGGGAHDGTDGAMPDEDSPARVPDGPAVTAPMSPASLPVTDDAELGGEDGVPPAGGGDEMPDEARDAEDASAVTGDGNPGDGQDAVTDGEETVQAEDATDGDADADGEVDQPASEPDDGTHGEDPVPGGEDGDE